MTAFSLIMSACNTMYVACYKDKFRDLFTEAETDKDNVIYLGMDREILEEYYWNEAAWSNMTFAFWYEWVSSAEETETLPEYLKEHGYKFTRTDDFTVEATKGE